MNVLWVALLTSVKQMKLDPQTWFPVLIALVGAITLELHGSATPSIGDIWLLLQPIGFGTGYVLLDMFMKGEIESDTKENSVLLRKNNTQDKEVVNSEAITAFTLSTVAILTVTSVVLNNNIDPAVEFQTLVNSPIALGGIIFTSVATTVLPLYLQSIAFKHVSATDASMILTTEPIWAAIVSCLLRGEILSLNDATGGFLLLAAALSNEIRVLDRVSNALEEKLPRIPRKW